MLRLIKAELYKLFKNKSFKVLCLVAAILAGITITLNSTMTEESYLEGLGDIPMEQKLEKVEASKKASSEIPVVVPGQLGINTGGAKNPFELTPLETFHISFGVGVLEILIGVLVGAMFAKEYSKDTLKNTLAYGKKREHFYFAKLLAISVGVAIIIVIQVLIPTIATAIIRDFSNILSIASIVEISKVFLAAMILYMAIISITMFITTLVKSNGGVIGITVALFIGIPTFLSFNYGRFEWFDKLYELTIFYNTSLVTAIKATNDDILKGVFVGTVTLIISLIAGIMVFKKQDIK